MAAIKFLNERLAAAERNGWSSRFAANLTDQREFQWTLYLPVVSGGEDILRAGVVEFWVVWVGRGYQRPGFYVALQDGTEFVIFPGDKWPLANDAVQAVMWYAWVTLQ
jgi:hypothetical protein